MTSSVAVYQGFSGGAVRASPAVGTRGSSLGLPALRTGATIAHFAGPNQPPVPDFERDTMEPAAILTFVLVGGFVWGGLLVLLTTAVRKEREKGAGE